MMTDAYIVAFGRSPVVRGRQAGTYFYDKPEDIAAQVVTGVLGKLGPDFDTSLIEDVMVGCSVPENLQGMNIARKISLRAGLGVEVPAQTINRFCASGLQAIATAANAIQSGQMEVVLAGGLEFASTTPATSPEMTNNLYLEEEGPSISTWMGLTAENLAERYAISKEDQHRFALRSHQLAHQAQLSGKLAQEIIPVRVKEPYRTETGQVAVREVVVDQDQGIRPDTSLEQMAGLPTIFKKDGTVTAASSSQISDGAAFVLLMSGQALERYGLKPLAKFLGYQVVGVQPDYMGIGPVLAIPRLLNKVGLTLDQLDLIELTEAFAAQSLACIQELKLPLDKVNVNGGAIALGHPNGATGAVLTSRLLTELARRPGSRYGLVSMCIGGGMGAAGLFEIIHQEDWHD